MRLASHTASASIPASCPTRFRLAWERMFGRMDPGYAHLLRRVKGLLDPAGIMDPGRLGL